MIMDYNNGLYDLHQYVKKWSSHEDEINVWVKCVSFRSSLSQMFFKIGVPKCFANSQESTCVGVSF